MFPEDVFSQGLLGRDFSYYALHHIPFLSTGKLQKDHFSEGPPSYLTAAFCTRPFAYRIVITQ